MTTAENRSRGVKQEKQIVLIINSDCKKQFITCYFSAASQLSCFPVKTAEGSPGDCMEFILPLLIMTEISLPISGLETLKNVEQNPRTRKVPVLIYTMI